MIKNNYDIFPKINGEAVNFVTNSSSRIYKNNVLVSDFPIGDFSRYIDTINEGFYIKENLCKFVGVSYFIDDAYVVISSSLGGCLKFDSNNKTNLIIKPTNVYNTVTFVLELTNVYNYLFFVWDDKWDIVYKEAVSAGGQVWSGNIPEAYYVLYINTNNPPTTTIEYGNGESDVYTESLIVFYAGRNTTITFSGSGTETIYLRSIGAGEFLVKTTAEGLYMYSKNTKIGPFKLPINTPCVLDFEYFVNKEDTDVFIYCNYFLIGSGKLINFHLNKEKPININISSINIQSTLFSSKMYSCGLFVSKKPCPASVYDICCRSINYPISKSNIYDNDNIFIYKTDYAVWVLDYYNNTLMVLYGDRLKRSTISSLYNNLMYAHDNYITTSYGFSLDRYRIVDVLYNNGVFILLLEDRLVIIDKFGVVLRYIYCKNISKLFYIDNYVLFYDKTRARLYRIYSNDFRNFELPSVLMNVDFDTKYKICQVGGPFSVVNNDYVSVVKEQSVFGYRPLYDYFDIRTYTIDSNTKSNLLFEYDLVQNATKFTGINTLACYRIFANNPIEDGLKCFTLFVSIKAMSLEFKRYIVRIPEVLDVYMEDGKFKVDLCCVNTKVSVECFCLFNVNVWYDIYITYHSSTGIYIYVNGNEAGKKEFSYDTGGTLGQKYITIGGYGFDSYSAYKFKGFIRGKCFISRSFVNETVVRDLNKNGVRDPKTFSEYNTYIDVAGVTDLLYENGLMFVGTYDGLYIYETTSFKLIKILGAGSAVLDLKKFNDNVFANLIDIPASGELVGLPGNVVKINEELYGKIFLSGNKACNSCIYNGNTYVELVNGSAFVIDVSDYFGKNTNVGYYNLGKFSIDSLNNEIQLVGEFGYDEKNDVVLGDTYANSILSDKAIACCTSEWGSSSAYAEDVCMSSILYYNDITRSFYDLFLDIKYQNESNVFVNLFDILVELNYVLLCQNPYEYTYKFIIGRHGVINYPYEPVSISIAESLAGFLGISPCRLYHSESSLFNLSRIKFCFEVSSDNFKLLKERKTKVLENYIESSSRFAYDFRGGLGNGVKHRIEDGFVFGTFDGNAYFINNEFNDTLVYNFSAEFVLRLTSVEEFNPIFSKSTKSKLSYGLALYGRELKFLFGQNGINSVLDLDTSINVGGWVFVAIYVSDTYIDILVDGVYKRIPFYGIIDVVESEVYVGFGISLNNRASNFVGDMLYFDINKSGSLVSINYDYSIYITSKVNENFYDEVVNLDKYYNVDNTTFKIASTFYSSPSNPLTRFFRLYDFYFIGSDRICEVSSVEENSIFSRALLKKVIKINVDTLDYVLHSFTGCSDFAYDGVGGLYSITKDNEIEYSLENISNIDKLKYITTIKYLNNFVLFGTIGGVVKINNIFDDNLMKQYWLFDNGVNDILVSDDNVYIASGKSLGFVQIKYLEDILDGVIVRKVIPVYSGDSVIKSVIQCNSKIYILSNEKIINITDGVEVCYCGKANGLFNYNNDVLVVYDNYIKRVKDDKIILTISEKITDVSYGDFLVVSSSSGFYIFDDVFDEFRINLVGIEGILKDFAPVSNYCYHVYINNNHVVYIYRDVAGIRLLEFDLNNKIKINDVILVSLTDGSFSDFVPITLDSIGR